MRCGEAGRSCQAHNLELAGSNPASAPNNPREGPLKVCRFNGSQRELS